MRILLDDDLVEAGLTLCLSGAIPDIGAKELAPYHRDRESCYRVTDDTDRTAAFMRVQSRWFDRLGLRAALEAPLERFPELSAVLEDVVYRRSRGRHDEGSELYRDEFGRRRGVLALRPDRLVAARRLEGFLNHEWMHVVDLLDDRFGGGTLPDSWQRGASQARVERERYRLLWAIRVDGVLARRGLEGQGGERARRDEFDRAFRFLEESRRGEQFRRLWEGEIETHTELLGLASDPRQLGDRAAAVPGGICPLCGFAAFRWTPVTELPRDIEARIRRDFPRWHSGEPVCARCSEIYSAISGVSYPATVCL